MSTETTDRIAISELFNRYADALDYKRWDLLEDVYTEDAVADWPSGDPDNPRLLTHGRADIIAFVRRMLGTDEIATHHMVGNFSAAIDGASAQATVRMRAHHAGVGPREGKFEESLGTFSATLTRTPEGWRIASMKEDIFIMLGDAEVFAPELGVEAG